MIIVATILHGKTSGTRTVPKKEGSNFVSADLTVASVATFILDVTPEKSGMSQSGHFNGPCTATYEFPKHITDPHSNEINMPGNIKTQQSCTLQIQKISKISGE